MNEKFKKRLKELTSIIGVAGREQSVVKELRESLLKVSDEVNIDPMGNIVAVKKGNKPGPKMLFGAHVDEVGLMVRNINSKGFIMFEKLGIVPDLLLPASKVIIDAKNGPVSGVIGMKSAHLMSPEEAKSIQTPATSFIDIGATSREEVLNLGIDIGTRIAFDNGFNEFLNDRISSRAIDNRIGCLILEELMTKFKEGNFAGELWTVYTVQEELGVIGAKAMTHKIDKINPDYIIAIDTMPVADTPDANFILLPVELGKGPVCAFEYGFLSMGLSFTHNVKLKEWFEAISREEDINIQFVTAINKYATDANAFTLNHTLPIGGLSIPRRYSHSPAELMDIKDAVKCYEILEHIVKRNGEKNLNFI